MKPFIFSADAHIAEPADLFTSKMSPHLAQWHINGLVEGDWRIVRIGETIMLKVPKTFHDHKTGAEQGRDADIQRRGSRDLALRMIDMERDGVDAEICFPSLGLMCQKIDDREAAREAAMIYNDWLWDYVADYRDKLVACAILPIQNIDDTLAELKRVEAIGYSCAMLPPVLPETMPNYNQPVWDAVFAFAGEHDMPLIFHTGTGYAKIRALKGPGGGLFNYTRQMNDSVEVITMLVGGGVLDRNPQAKILFVEHGAGWLMGLAQRMDEVYVGHAPSITPKLSRKPSEIVRDQVRCSFQNDIGCLLTRSAIGVETMLFASDYPHSEGTFPYTREVVAEMFEAVPDMTQDEREAVLGLNAVRMFPRAGLAEPAARKRATAEA